MGRGRGISGRPVPHRRRHPHRLHAARRRGRLHPHRSGAGSRCPCPRTAAAAHRADRPGARTAPQQQPRNICVPLRPGVRRLHLPRRRPARTAGPPLSAQAQPHQPLHSSLPRLPLRGAHARPFRRVHDPRTPMAPGPRGPRLRAVRRTASHAAGIRPLRRTGPARRVSLRRRAAGGVRPSTTTRSSPTSKRPTRRSRGLSRSSTNFSPSTCPRNSPSSTARRTSASRGSATPSSPTIRPNCCTSSRPSGSTPTKRHARRCG